MMRLQAFALLTGLLLPAAAAPAQTLIRLGAGGVAGTRLLGDRVNPFDEIYGTNLKQRTAPAVQLGASFPMTPSYRVRFEGTLASTTLDIHDEDTGEVREFGDLRTLTLLALVEGKIVPSLDWQAGVGQILYLPGERLGLFHDGGPHKWMIALGLSKRFPVARGISAALSARYDYHQFTTPTLTDYGWSQYHTVHRAGLFLGLERAF